MTRLTSGWIADIENELAALDEELQGKTGLSMRAVAARAAGLSESALAARLSNVRAAAVSVTSGLGTIGRFAGSVAAIVRYMGASVFVPGACDVDGFYEAAARGAQIVFMADDDRFVAINRTNGKIGENDIATATGYAIALDAMSGSLAGEPALLLGFGRVGKIAAGILNNMGAVVHVYDTNDAVFENGFQYTRVRGKTALRDFKYILDLTCEGAWLHAGDLAPGVKMAAPGVPLSLDESAAAMYGKNVYHDVLPLGAAVMLALAV